MRGNLSGNIDPGDYTAGFEQKRPPCKSGRYQHLSNITGADVVRAC
jgi:hypothetical protein